MCGAALFLYSLPGRLSITVTVMDVVMCGAALFLYSLPGRSWCLNASVMHILSVSVNTLCH